MQHLLSTLTYHTFTYYAMKEEEGQMDCDSVRQGTLEGE